MNLEQASASLADFQAFGHRTIFWQKSQRYLAARFATLQYSLVTKILKDYRPALKDWEYGTAHAFAEPQAQCGADRPPRS